jgi:hypothetical protein
LARTSETTERTETAETADEHSRGSFLNI